MDDGGCGMMNDVEWGCGMEVCMHVLFQGDDIPSIFYSSIL